MLRITALFAVALLAAPARANDCAETADDPITPWHCTAEGYELLVGAGERHGDERDQCKLELATEREKVDACRERRLTVEAIPCPAPETQWSLFAAGVGVGAAVVAVLVLLFQK